MRLVITVLLLGACDRALGIKATQLWDATPPDAPFACPPIGTTPRFSPGIHQLPQSCDHYVTTPGGLAMARCALGVSLMTQIS